MAAVARCATVPELKFMRACLTRSRQALHADLSALADSYAMAAFRTTDLIQAEIDDGSRIAPPDPDRDRRAMSFSADDDAPLFDLADQAAGVSQDMKRALESADEQIRLRAYSELVEQLDDEPEPDTSAEADVAKDG